MHLVVLIKASPKRANILLVLSRKRSCMQTSLISTNKIEAIKVKSSTCRTTKATNFVGQSDSLGNRSKQWL